MQLNHNFKQDMRSCTSHSVYQAHQKEGNERVGWVRWPPRCEPRLVESPEGLSASPPQRAAPARTWQIWATAWGTGSNSCTETPSRTSLAGRALARPQVSEGSTLPIHSRLVVSACSPGHRDKETDGNCLWTALDRSLIASCKDSIGWMFSKLDTNGDLYLEHGELAAINLDKYEVCIRPFFNSCDSYKDGKVSTAEWCLCFWRESECGGRGRGGSQPALTNLGRDGSLLLILSRTISFDRSC